MFRKRLEAQPQNQQRFATEDTELTETCSK